MTDILTPAARAGWFETIKKALNIDNLMKKLDMSRDKLINIGLYLAAGFLVGFLLKKYSRYVFTVVLCVAALVVLHYANIITVTLNWQRLQEFGIGQISATMDATLLNVYWEWVKLHVAVVLSFSVGFLIGVKVG